VTGTGPGALGAVAGWDVVSIGAGLVAGWVAGSVVASVVGSVAGFVVGKVVSVAGAVVVDGSVTERSAGGLTGGLAAGLGCTQPLPAKSEVTIAEVINESRFICRSRIPSALLW
jgi:hypothetical protein